MKAVWVPEYDMTTDSIYNCPGCPECNAPIGRIGEDGRYYCYCCHEPVDVEDPQMLEWFKEQQKEKIEYTDCAIINDRNGKYICGCGGKKTVAVHYLKNPVNKEWYVAFSECSKCGQRMIV